MLDERKASILRAVVEEYIQTAQPVGSGHVARSGTLKVSSATVRNDMAVLEQEGYLAQPHTSAGRIPTDKGYRFFVDELSGPGHLDRASTQQVRTFFDTTHGELERMLHDTTRLLSDLTQYAAVVVAPQAEASPVRSVQLVSLAPSVVLVVVVLGNGGVEKCTVELGETPSEDVLARAAAALSAHVVGRSSTSILEVRPTGDQAVDGIASTVQRAWRAVAAGAEPEQLYVGGAARMASAFDAVDTVRRVLTILEQQLVVVQLVRDVLDRGLQVAIGSETGVELLGECSLVVAPYEIDGEPVGSIGVLGPTRMNYPQALAAVAVVSQRLGHRLTEG